MFLSLADRDKAAGVERRRAVRRRSASTIAATVGHRRLPDRAAACRSRRWWRSSASRAARDAVELIASGQVQLVVNSPRGRGPRADGAHIRSRRRRATACRCLTTVAAGLAAADGMADWARHPLRVRSLQEYHAASDDQLELDLMTGSGRSLLGRSPSGASRASPAVRSGSDVDMTTGRVGRAAPIR